MSSAWADRPVCQGRRAEGITAATLLLQAAARTFGDSFRLWHNSRPQLLRPFREWHGRASGQPPGQC